MNNFEKSYIAKIIKKRRKEFGLKQAQLAELIGISEKHLSKIETGKNYPALDNFLKMVMVLKLSFEDFGIESEKAISENKEKLKALINIASEKRLSAYLEMIKAVNKYIE